ncbi:prophage antirepressor-like protein [Roseovarius sp. MBR-51]
MSTFNFRGFDLRCVEIDGQPWFAAKDICNAVLLPNVSMALMNINPIDVQDYRLRETKGGRPNKMVSESGLYKIIMRSDKAEAKAFQDWVTRDVLPAIRKDGGYIMGEEKVAPSG